MKILNSEYVFAEIFFGFASSSVVGSASKSITAAVLFTAKVVKVRKDMLEMSLEGGVLMG